MASASLPAMACLIVVKVGCDVEDSLGLKEGRWRPVSLHVHILRSEILTPAIIFGYEVPERTVAMRTPSLAWASRQLMKLQMRSRMVPRPRPQRSFAAPLVGHQRCDMEFVNEE